MGTVGVIHPAAGYWLLLYTRIDFPTRTYGKASAQGYANGQSARARAMVDSLSAAGTFGGVVQSMSTCCGRPMRFGSLGEKRA
jgi:hypothetical protein